MDSSGAGEHGPDHPLDEADFQLGAPGVEFSDGRGEVGPSDRITMLGGLLHCVRDGVRLGGRQARFDQRPRHRERIEHTDSLSWSGAFGIRRIPFRASANRRGRQGPIIRI